MIRCKAEVRYLSIGACSLWRAMLVRGLVLAFPAAGELRECVLLEELTLEHNRLTSVLLSFASLRKLRLVEGLGRLAGCAFVNKSCVVC
jgi:hypothetical protein